MDRYQKQFLLYAQAEFAAHHHIDSSQVLDIYITALKETYPNFTINPITDFSGHQLLLSEIKTLLGISTILHKNKEYTKVRPLLALIEQYLVKQANITIELEQYAVLYPIATDLYVQCLLSMKDHKSALDYANKGINCCTTYGKLFHFMNLSFSKGLALIALDNIIEGKEILRNTLFAAEATETEEIIAYYQERLYSLYGEAFLQEVMS